MNLIPKDVAVSLVDDSFIFSTQTQTNPLVLPAYVAMQACTSRVLACGDEAKAMLDREPKGISVVRVLAEGMIADHQAAESLFRFGVRKLLGAALLVRPRVIVALRAYDPGKLPVKNMATAGGAREVYLIDMGMATAIGMELEVQEPELRAVLSVSEDWFDFSIISLAGVLAGASGAVGSRTLVEDIQNHLSLARQVRPDFSTLKEQLKSVGVDSDAAVTVPGWEVWAGRSEQGKLVTQSVSAEDMTIGLMPSLIRMTERIKSAIRTLPNEKQYQLNQTTINATGTAMVIPGLAQAIANQLGYAVTPHASSIHPSIEGCKCVLKQLKFLKKMKTTKT